MESIRGVMSIPGTADEICLGSDLIKQPDNVTKIIMHCCSIPVS